MAETEPQQRTGRAWPGVAFGLAACSLAALLRTALSGSLGVSDRPAPWDFWVRALWWIGITVAGVSYLALVRGARGPVGRLHLRAALVVHLCAAPATPLTSNDALMNLAYGRLVQLGIDPYRQPPAALPRGDPFASVDWPRRLSAWGPLPTLAGAAAAGLPSRAAAFVAFKATMLAASLAAVLLAYAFVRRSGAQRASAGFTAFAFNPVLAWELSGQAHNDALLVLPTVGFVWAACAGRPLAAAALAAAAVAAKHALLPALALYVLALLRSSPPRGLQAALAATLTLAAAWAPFWTGPASLRGALVAVVPSPQRVENSLASLVSLAGSLLDAREGLLRAWSVFSAGVLLVAAVGVAARATAVDRALVGSLRFLLVVLCLGTAYFQPWYATWLLPFLLSPAATGWRGAIALYTALLPALYLTRAPGALAALLVQGLGLVIALRGPKAAR